MKHVTLIYLLLVMLVPFTLTQDDTPQVEVIPILSSMPRVDLSSDGTTMAFYDMGVLQNDEIVIDLLPIKLVDIESGELSDILFQGSDYTRAMAISPDGTRLATTEFDGDLFIWDMQSGDLIKEIDAMPGQNVMVFIDDGHLATVGGGILPIIAVWDIELGHIVQIVSPDVDTYQEFRDQEPMTMQSQNITAMISPPDTNSLIVAVANDNLYAVDLETGDRQPLRTTENDLPMLSIRHMILARDNSAVYFMSRIPTDEMTAYRLDLTSGEETPIVTVAEESRLVAIGVDEASDRLLWLEQVDGSPLLFVDSLSNPGDPIEIVPPDDLPEDLRMVGNDIRILFAPDGNTAIIGGLVNTGDHENALIKVTFN